MPAPFPSANPLPIYTCPPSFNPVSQAIDQALLAALCDAIAQSVENIPHTLASPNPTTSISEHPGEDWQINFSSGCIHHSILIPTPDN